MKECCSLLLLALVLSFYNAITKNLAASVNSLFVRRQWELLNNNLLVHMKFLNGKFQEIIHPMWYLATFGNYTISRGEKSPTCSQTIFICSNVKPGCCQITSLVFSILHSPFFFTEELQFSTGLYYFCNNGILTGIHFTSSIYYLP